MGSISDAEFDARLAAVLAENDASHCPSCQRKIDRGDLAWNSASTEYGTGYSVVEIQCQNCLTEIAKISSWYPSIEDLDDLIYVLETDWGSA